MIHLRINEKNGFLWLKIVENNQFMILLSQNQLQPQSLKPDERTQRGRRRP